MSRESEAREFLRSVLEIAIPALASDDTNPDQGRRFAESIVRALDGYIDAKLGAAAPTDAK